MQSGQEYVVAMAIFNVQRAITPKVCNQEFIAGRPKAALLLWFFGDFRCGALLFIVILVIYKYGKRQKNSC